MVVNEYRNSKASIMSGKGGEMWRKVFEAIKDKRLSSVEEDVEYTPSGSLQCEYSKVY